MLTEQLDNVMDAELCAGQCKEIHIGPSGEIRPQPVTTALNVFADWADKLPAESIRDYHHSHRYIVLVHSYGTTVMRWTEPDSDGETDFRVFTIY